MGRLTFALAFCAVLFATQSSAQEFPSRLRQDHRAVRRRRPRRRYRAIDREDPSGRPQAAFHRGEQARGRRGHRNARSREGTGRRLYAAHDVECPDGKRISAATTKLQPDARLRPGRPHQHIRSCHGGPSGGASQNLGGVHRPRQGSPWKTELRIIRTRHAVSHGRRAV